MRPENWMIGDFFTYVRHSVQLRHSYHLASYRRDGGGAAHEPRSTTIHERPEARARSVPDARVTPVSRGPERYHGRGTTGEPERSPDVGPTWGTTARHDQAHDLFRCKLQCLRSAVGCKPREAVLYPDSVHSGRRRPEGRTLLQGPVKSKVAVGRRWRGSFSLAINQSSGSSAVPEAVQLYCKEVYLLLARSAGWDPKEVCKHTCAVVARVRCGVVRGRGT